MLPPWDFSRFPLANAERRKKYGLVRYDPVRSFIVILGIYAVFFGSLLMQVPSPEALPQSLQALGVVSLSFFAVIGAVFAFVYQLQVFGYFARVSAQLSSARHQTNTWPLVVLGTMPRRRWLQNQLMVLGHLVWPTQRVVLFFQALSIVLIWAQLLDDQFVKHQRPIFDGEGYLSPFLFSTAILPFVLYYFCAAMADYALFASLALVNTNRKISRHAFFLRGQLGVFAWRTTAALVFTIPLIVITAPLLRSPVVWLLLAIFASPMFGFFLGLLPILPIFLLSMSGTPEEHLRIWSAFMISCGLTYLVLPMLAVRLTTGKAIELLERP